MTRTFHGKHLIDGTWVKGGGSCTSARVHGEGHAVCDADPDTVDRACKAAEAAFWDYSRTTQAQRAAFLEIIAEEIEARGSEITRIGYAETGLPDARLEGERGRTTGQLRLFAAHIRTGAHLDRRHDPAQPDRAPLPRPDLKLVQRPVGPAAVFGASNFPLAFSTAGGDTAAALAAGCPVIVKGHPAHPGTSEIVAEAIAAAITRTDMPTGTFALIQSGSHAGGVALVQHPLITAVGFTGSLRAGRTLFDLCAARPVPIPFFGELGSINPVFVLPTALAARGPQIAKAWAGSLTMGVGQFCTNPGLLILPPGAEPFVEAAREALSQVAAQDMLTTGIAQAYRAGRDHQTALADTTSLLQTSADDGLGAPSLLQTHSGAWLGAPDMAEEVFGPHGLLVHTEGADDMLCIAHALPGQLTATLQMDDPDTDLAARLMPVLERKAGRILANGFPTGVEVADAMVHGGPYPASTNFGATSVGTMAIRRFLRPVCYQDIPDDLIP